MADKDKKKMVYVPLGNSGLQVSRICFGVMSFGPGDTSVGPMWAWTQTKEHALPFVKKAIESGINFFDTANFYSQGQSEVILGQCLKELGVPRDDVVIATKFSIAFGTGPNNSGRSRKHIFACVDASLKRLGTDYIDLYIVHSWTDKVTPLEETMEALNDLVRAGKVRYLGTSNNWAWQIVKANAIAEKHGWTKFISVQNLYNTIYREDEREVIAACIDQGVGYTPWSPLAGGFLTGSRTKGQKTETARGQTAEQMFPQLHPIESDWPIIDRVVELAKKKGVSPAQIATAWVLSKPGVSSAIVGATKPLHLEDAIAAVHVQLTAEEIKHLDELYQPHPSPPFR